MANRNTISVLSLYGSFVAFTAFVVVTVLIPLCGRFLTKWFVPVLSAVAGIVIISSFMYNDKNYINEMRMTRIAEANVL